MLEDALKSLPMSYKIWKMYLLDAIKQVCVLNTNRSDAVAYA